MQQQIDTSFAELAAEIARYGGNLQTFADSPDALDRAAPAALRRQAAALAELVAGQADDVAEAAAVALDAACSGDAYARRELAGRFRSAVRRLRVAAAIERHPRAAQFVGLRSAVLRGRCTSAQWQLACALAKEAR
jgi:hypothetical protein